MTNKVHPFDRPAIRISWTLVNGEKLEREWTMRQGPPKPFPPPAWLLNPGSLWPKPGDPITIVGDILPGHESDAEAFLEALP